MCMLWDMSTHTAPQQLLSPAEFAEYLGVPLPTVRSWIARGHDLPPRAHIGRRTYFRRADVEMWLESKFDHPTN